MTRYQFIERHSRQIYGGFATDDASIGYNLINYWLPDAIGIAAKQCYKDSIQLDGIGYVNNSFYSTFKGLTVSKDENFLWKVTLPEIPVGIGMTEGVNTMVFKDSSGNISFPVMWLSENQKAYARKMRPIPNAIMAYTEGIFAYAISTILLNTYTVNITMISGGDSTNLDSVLNVPPDYFPIMVDYLQKQLILERNQPVDASNDGLDAIKTT